MPTDDSLLDALVRTVEGGAIHQQVLASIVNLLPTYEHWPQNGRFLLLHGDDRNEIYQEGVHLHADSCD
jgi:hypothetical protein